MEGRRNIENTDILFLGGRDQYYIKSSSLAPRGGLIDKMLLVRKFKEHSSVQTNELRSF